MRNEVGRRDLRRWGQTLEQEIVGLLEPNVHGAHRFVRKRADPKFLAAAIVHLQELKDELSSIDLISILKLLKYINEGILLDDKFKNKKNELSLNENSDEDNDENPSKNNYIKNKDNKKISQVINVSIDLSEI